MFKKLSLFLLISILFFSCSKEENLPPSALKVGDYFIYEGDAEKGQGAFKFPPMQYVYKIKNRKSEKNRISRNSESFDIETLRPHQYWKNLRSCS